MKTQEKSWKTQLRKSSREWSKNTKSRKQERRGRRQSRESSVWMRGIPDREKKENNWESINKIIYENVPDLKLVSFQIEKSQWAHIPSKENTPTLRPIAVQFQTLETKGRPYKLPRRKKEASYKGSRIRFFFWLLNNNTRRQRAMVKWQNSEGKLFLT